MIIETNSEEQWEEHLHKLLTNIKYCQDNCQLNNTDQILVIQTCNLSPKNTFLILIAKKSS